MFLLHAAGSMVLMFGFAKLKGPEMIVNICYLLMFQDSSTNSVISEISNKIDTEIASLKTLMESNKLDTIRYLAGM